MRYPTPDKYIASQVDVFVEQALADRRIKQPALVLTAIPSEFSDKADVLDGVTTSGKSFAIDHEYLLHIVDIHGGNREIQRGQIPVSGPDLAVIATHLHQAKAIQPGNPPRAKNGAFRIKARLEMDPYLIDIVLEVRRHMLVPVTVWKRRT